MEQHDRTDTLDHRPATGPSLLLLGIWLRSIFIGAAFALAGLAALLDRAQGLPALTAMTWVAAGGTFAWLAWQRTAALLERLIRRAGPQPQRLALLLRIGRAHGSS
jgi:hypothetical protein